MNCAALFEKLIEHGAEELGILDPVPLEECAGFLQESFNWIRESSPTFPRTFWCLESKGFPSTSQLDLVAKSRFIPMDAEKHQAWSHGMGPFQAVLKRGNEKPQLIWQKLYDWAGDLEAAGRFGDWTLWVWRSKFPQRRALLVCHHSGVLPDVRRQLIAIGVKGDFYWLCDGKPPNGDSWPSTFGHLDSSVPLLQGPYDQKFSEEIVADVKQKYSFICTSHCMRYPIIFAQFGLPLIHINSTRYSNYVVKNSAALYGMNARIKALLSKKQLTIIHNNRADAWYFEQYITRTGTTLSSICDSALRFRISTPRTRKFLLWDTRSHVGAAKSPSPTLCRLAELLGVEVTSVLSKAAGGWLQDDMLKGYDAVIHIPYNISTMSCFEQGSANIPIWVPTARLLKEILLREYSELSWYCFGGDLSTAERPDRIRDADVVEEYVSRADFYCGVFDNVLLFDSVEELAARLQRTEYDKVIKKSYHTTVRNKLAMARGLAVIVP